MLANRTLELAIDTLLLRDNRIDFDITKTLKPDPNTAIISVYNLTDDQRQQITSAKAPLVRLAAGYGDQLSQIFHGNLLHVEHKIEDSDVITVLSTGDGAESYRKARVKLSFGPNTKAGTVLRALIKSLGLSEGNAQKAIRDLERSTKADIYVAGTVVSGSAAQEITRLLRSANLTWSVQDGALQVLAIGETLATVAIKLAPDTGLIGSPTLDNKGLVKGTCLLIPDFFPGRQVEVKSRFVDGHFRVDRCQYVGSVFTDEWYIHFEAQDVTRLAKAA